MGPLAFEASPNWDARKHPISLVILHYTGMQNGEIARARLCDPAPIAGRYRGPWQSPQIDDDTPLNPASAHYLVLEDGRVERLVSEDKRAWHAGAGSWQGEGALNDRSIGVEIVNGGHDFGLPPYAEAQIAALIALVREICARHGLGPRSVIGHSDVAPTRKADPGEHFPWHTLAQADLALWPRISAPELRGIDPLQAGDRGAKVEGLQAQLIRFGYGLDDPSGVFEAGTQACVTAFQRRFRPGCVDGRADGQTLALLADLLAQ